MFTNWHPTEPWILTILQSELSKALLNNLAGKLFGQKLHLLQHWIGAFCLHQWCREPEVPLDTSESTHPSVAGFLRSMLGRGDEPWAGALVLTLWLWVCTTVVAAGAALNGLLIGLATIVAPSASTTAGGHGGGRTEPGEEGNRSNMTKMSHKTKNND